jgi:hypothetical protein
MPPQRSDRFCTNDRYKQLSIRQSVEGAEASAADPLTVGNDLLVIMVMQMTLILMK